jgi:hypothetical protein
MGAGGACFNALVPCQILENVPYMPYISVCIADVFSRQISHTARCIHDSRLYYSLQLREQKAVLDYYLVMMCVRLKAVPHTAQQSTC